MLKSGSLQEKILVGRLKLKDKEAFSAIRFSLGLFTTKADIDYSLMRISKALAKQ